MSNNVSSVKRHTCPDETATVVNGRWICNCPGGPYPAPQPAGEDPAGECSRCGGPVYNRAGKPGEFDHKCNPQPAAEGEGK